MEYKVLWVDDQDFTALITVAEVMGLDITQVHSWSEAEPLLENHFDEWSALILDCYCTIEKNGPENPRFLREVFPRLHKLQGNHRTLPWYVLSQGNKERFDEIIDNTLSNERLQWDSSWEKGYYSKSAIDAKTQEEDWKIMLRNILTIAKKSEENIIRNKYPKAFEAAKYIGGSAEHDLLDFLVDDHNNNLTDTYRYYNLVRIIMESIFKHGKEHSIFPPLTDINGYGALLDKGCVFGWRIKKYDAFIPKALGHAASFLLDFTNTGSHHNKVRSYIEETKNINLFRAMLFIEMDLLAWYHQLCTKIFDPNNHDYNIGDLWERYNPSISITNVRVEEINDKGKPHFIVKSSDTVVELWIDRRINPQELAEGVYVNIKKYHEGNKRDDIAPNYCLPADYTILYKKVTILDQDGNELLQDFVSEQRKARVVGNEKCYQGMPLSVNVYPKDGFYIDSIKQNNGLCDNPSIKNSFNKAIIDFAKLEDDLVFIVTVLPCPHLEINCNIVEGGSVSGGNTLTPGNSFSITACPSQGYKFVEWTGCKVANKHNNQTTLIMPNKDTTITANFEKL